MEKLIHLSLTIILLSLSACSTPRNTQIDKQADYSSTISELSSQVNNLRSSVDRQTQTAIEKLSNLKLENKTIYLSPPDSTGRQYPTKESTTTASKEDHESTRINESIQHSVLQMSARIDSLYSLINASSSDTSKVVEVSWWTQHKNKIYCIIIISLIAIYFFKKKKLSLPS